MSHSDKSKRDVAAFILKASRAIARIIRDLSHAAQTLSELLDRIRENNQWWQRGIGPNSDGVYPENVFSQRWNNDDPPSFDLSA